MECCERARDEGFPDLMVIKDGKIAFFVEVKGGKTPHIGYSFTKPEGTQRGYHAKLFEKGFITKSVRVINDTVKIEEEQTWPLY